MGQNLITADFVGEDRIDYITDNRRYAKAQQGELQVMTGDKYEVVQMQLYIVRRKKINRDR